MSADSCNSTNQRIAVVDKYTMHAESPSLGAHLALVLDVDGHQALALELGYGRPYHARLQLGRTTEAGEGQEFKNRGKTARATQEREISR